MSRPFPLLIDTDPGVDDALALLLALHSPEVSVEAVSTVAGNVPVDVATTNLLRILEVARPARLPRVAQGASVPLARALVTATAFHGEDGLGNLDRIPGAGDRRGHGEPGARIEAIDGADLMLETAARFPGELVLVALGPLTNVAIALARDRQRLSLLSRMVVMGGAVAVPGNVTPAAEFNFFVDPEAAAAVLGAGLPVELVPLDVTRQTMLSRRALETGLAGGDERKRRFVLDLTAHSLAQGGGRIALHDPLAISVAIDPTFVGLERLHVEVECEGQAARGLSLADLRPRSDAERFPANASVATSVDPGRFVPWLLERLCPASA
jgi:inosine-uridine nucleoside N-ribohydrolase